jgi:hypothetical protein
VSDLLDGRLSPAEEERCWQHVHVCHTCRDLVEREAWLKNKLAGLGRREPCVSEDLKSALCAPSGLASSDMYSPVLRAAARPRGRSLLMIGGGAASACVVGVLALGAAHAPRVEPRPPATDLSRPTAPAQVTVPAADNRRRTSPADRTASPLTARLVALREKMVP